MGKGYIRREGMLIISSMKDDENGTQTDSGLISIYQDNSSQVTYQDWLSLNGIGGSTQDEFGYDISLNYDGTRFAGRFKK